MIGEVFPFISAGLLANIRSKQRSEIKHALVAPEKTFNQKRNHSPTCPKRALWSQRFMSSTICSRARLPHNIWSSTIIPRTLLVLASALKAYVQAISQEAKYMRSEYAYNKSDSLGTATAQAHQPMLLSNVNLSRPLRFSTYPP